MEQEERSVWLRCALFAYLDSDKHYDLVEEETAKRSVLPHLQETMEGFLEGVLNFGTLKYRLDDAATTTAHTFPPRSVTATLSDIALGIPIDKLEPAVRRAAKLPEDMGEAKGVVLDLEEFMERAVREGHLKRSQASRERWPELLACLWNIQDPSSWPVLDRAVLRYLIENGDISPLEPAQDLADYISIMRDLAERAGADLDSMRGLLLGLSEGAFVVPSEEECFSNSMAAAARLEQEGDLDGAIERYERALAIRPATPQALKRKADLFERKGLAMAAIGELETLIALEPENLADHRKLLSIYKSRKMVREYNIEVRRFKALMEKLGRI